MRRALLALTLILAPALVAAADDSTISCTPKTAATPNGEGSPMLWDMRLLGGWAAWWCPIEQPAGAPPGNYFRQHTWGGLYAYGWSKVWDASERVHTAANPNAQARAEVAALAASAANPVDACRQKAFRRDACVALRSASMPGYPGPFDALNIAQACGQAQDCDALPPPAAVWKTPASGPVSIYRVDAGVRKLIFPPKYASAATLCDCARLSMASGTSTYCTLASGPANEVAACVKAPP